jgi:putative addiction module antidote
MELKVRKIGNSFGVILPGEVIEQLQAKEGTLLQLLPNPQGPGFQLVPDTAEFSRQMEIARGLMQRYRETLRELAK